MGQHDLSWERVNALVAENGRLDREIDALVDEKKAIRGAADALAAALEWDARTNPDTALLLVAYRDLLVQQDEKQWGKAA